MGAGRDPKLINNLGRNVLTNSEILIGLPDYQITGIAYQEVWRGTLDTFRTLLARVPGLACLPEWRQVSCGA